MNENRFKNPYDILDFTPGETPMTESNITRLNQYRALVYRWAHNEEHGEIARTAFKEGVDAALEMLRPLLADTEFNRNDPIWPVNRYYFDHDDALQHCISCAEPDGSPHLEQCVWPKIDAILGGGK